ncbi:MAG: molybdopterin-dependent oxidoreductase, partial [Acidimicrobiia bacterium]
SLTTEEAQSPDPLLVWEMNGEPLTAEHGSPIRLVVPGQYAMKSVKWLTSIQAADEPFLGHFVRKYRYFADATESEAAPVGAIQVRSLVAEPLAGTSVSAGPVSVGGAAWSDGASIDRVEVSIDGGKSWTSASVQSAASRFAPVRWEATIEVERGRVTLIARATDSLGRSQPIEPRWNGNGYANNVVHPVAFTVV